MTKEKAVSLLSQMFLIQFSKEEHEALAMAIDALNLEKLNSCETQTIRCPKCGKTDYIRDMEKDMGVKGSYYKYKCINCNTYIKDEPQTERG